MCCITSHKEAEIALKAGADLLGLVSEMPSGPGVIALDAIAKIVKHLPPATKTVLLTSKTKAEDILSQHNQVKTWGIQLVDFISFVDLRTLKTQLSNIQLIQVVHVTDETALAQANALQNLVDYLLLDSGNPKAKTKTLGGTGQTHDWNISRQICEASLRPVLLAGGLNPENIQVAANQVKPDGFDLCSGVRERGNLDPKRLFSFMENLAKVHMGIS